MSLLRDAIDYAQRGHIFFKDPDLRKEVFLFLENTLKRMADEKKAKGAGTYLQPIINLLENKKTFLITPDKGLKKLAQDFFKRNVELILKLSALAKNGYERESLIYMIIKFIPEFAEELPKIYELMIKGYLILIHTIYEAKAYKEGGCVELAVRGLYRWDGEELLETWGKDQLVVDIKSQLGDKEKKINPNIEKLISKVLEEINQNKNKEELKKLFGFLLFTKNSLNTVRLKLLKDFKKDILYELVQEIKDKVIKMVHSIGSELFDEKNRLISEIDSFLENRLDKKIPYVKEEETIKNLKVVEVEQDFS